MAIFDWIKELPLSAVLKEKLTDLEKENSALKAENAAQKLLLEECQEQRRALEEQVSEKRHHNILSEQRLVESLNEEAVKNSGF